MDPLSNASKTHRRYHATARNWAIDLDFFRSESTFLHRLLDGHIIKISNDTQRRELKDVADELLKLEIQKQEIDSLLIRHLTELEEPAKKLSNRSVLISTSHDEIEKVVANISSEYRRIKTELFHLVEMVITDQGKI